MVAFNATLSQSISFKILVITSDNDNNSMFMSSFPSYIRSQWQVYYLHFVSYIMIVIIIGMTSEMIDRKKLSSNS